MKSGNQLGKQLQTWRAARGLSRRGAALKAGLGKSTVAYWEAGQRLPSIPELNALLDALQVTAAERSAALALMGTPRAEQFLHVQEMKGAAVAPPCRSDLLRAMRLRSGCTQAELAARLEVAQSAVSRWERGEDWPALEHLHTFCYALGASEEELVALTTGSFLLEEISEEEEQDWSLLEKRFGEIVFSPSAASEALRDLNLLSFEAWLWKRRGKGVLVQDLLAGVYGWHAQRNRERGWMREANDLMQRLEILEREEIGRYHWWWHHVTVRGHLAAYQHGAPAPLEGARLLFQELENLNNLAVRAWVLGDLALYLAQAGEKEKAIALGQQAQLLAHRHGSGVEIRLRNRDLADVLVRTGRPEEALSLLPEASALYLISTIQEMQTRAEALLALKREAEAQMWLQRSREEMETHSLHYLRPRTERLSRRLTGQ